MAVRRDRKRHAKRRNKSRQSRCVQK